MKFKNMKVRYKWEKRHKCILNQYLEKLKCNEIRYFILRNYEGLPELNHSKDIDLIIEPGQYDAASNILFETFKAFDVPNYYVVKFERANCWIGIDLEDDFYIHIDLIEGYLNKGFEIFPFEELYQHTVEYNSYRVLSPDYDAVMLLIYKVIGCKELKEKYRNKISNLYVIENGNIQKILKYVFDRNFAKEIIEHLGKQDYDWIISNAKRLSNNSKKRAFMKRPLYTLKNIVYFILEKIQRIVICPPKMQKMIAVEAPDGAGKTTFIDLLCVRLAECFVTDISKVHVNHFRPNYLPNLGELGEKAGMMKQDRDFSRPHRGKKTSQVSSIVRLFYYWLDYVLGGFISIRKDVQFDKFSIYDRYAYDFLVDPRRSKINLPYIIRKLFAKMVPQPQITFFLNADANTIYSRKQELEVDEIKRQLKEFERLEKITRGYKQLDASKRPEEIVNEALDVIIDRFTCKIEK